MPGADAIPNGSSAGAVHDTIDEGALDAALRELLRTLELGRRVADQELEKLEQRFGPRVYSAFLHLLSHLSFPPDEARRLWGRIVEHADFMQRSLGTPVDPRVALVSYFVEVNRKLRQPKVIEMRVFEQACASAYRDELTGLYNYRYFDECVAQEVARADRSGRPMSLIVTDIDDFKQFNDRNGHTAANDVLRELGALLQRSLRETDVATRFGGEEFALVLPDTPKTEAAAVAERVRSAVERHGFPGGATSGGGRITVTLGLATYPADARSAGDLFRCADQALYVGKREGKNRVMLYGHSARSFGRVRANLDGELRVLESRSYRLTTRGVGEGGMHFLSDRRPAVGAFVDVVIALPGTSRRVRSSAVVLRVEPAGQGRWESAVQFLSMNATDRRELARYVRETMPAGTSGPDRDSGA